MGKAKVLNNMVDKESIGYKIDLLIHANIKNWEGKEIFYNEDTNIDEGNKSMINSFQQNKIRNKTISDINHLFHGTPRFHFRNYHNY